jgi:hypothetical protein
MSDQNFTPVNMSPQRSVWSAYAAAAWSFLFAVMSFYWALGGTAGAETLGSAFTDPAVVGDPVFVAFLWITAALKALIGLIALALIHVHGKRLLRRLLLIAAWGTGILLSLYGAALLIQHGLMALGSSNIPASIGSMTAVRWHLFFWDPFWLLGGILFLAAARFAKSPDK